MSAVDVTRDNRAGENRRITVLMVFLKLNTGVFGFRFVEIASEEVVKLKQCVVGDIELLEKSVRPGKSEDTGKLLGCWHTVLPPAGEFAT